MDTLTGKVAVITGGASGIGFALARRMGGDGAKVVIGDIEEPALAAAVAALEEEGVDVLGVTTDVADAASVEALRDAAVSRHGTVHVVCNNAGVGGGGLMSDTTLDDWQWCLGVNLWGVIHGISSFLPVLLEQGEGHIVNTASLAGLVSNPFMGPYNASKFAVVAISETLALEMAMTASGVGVSVLCPAFVQTNIHRASRNRPGGASGADDGVESVIASLVAAGIPPEEVADAVVEAVLGDRFYVLTHPDSVRAVEARGRAIVAGAAPPTMMPRDVGVGEGSDGG